ncbi:MAG: rhodanese-like domain-containing protein [Coriobacteriales bacterium]|jgi:phage shock protein E
MGLVGGKASYDTNGKAREAQQDPAITLIDVRSADEYAEGHIPGAINVPILSIGDIEGVVPDKSARIYVSCQSGKRSDRAIAAMRELGYENLENIGGISGWDGPVEK